MTSLYDHIISLICEQGEIVHHGHPNHSTQQPPEKNTKRGDEFINKRKIIEDNIWFFKHDLLDKEKEKEKAPLYQHAIDYLDKRHSFLAYLSTKFKFDFLKKLEIKSDARPLQDNEVYMVFSTKDEIIKGLDLLLRVVHMSDCNDIYIDLEGDMVTNPDDTAGVKIGLGLKREHRTMSMIQISVGLGPAFLFYCQPDENKKVIDTYITHGLRINSFRQLLKEKHCIFYSMEKDVEALTSHLEKIELVLGNVEDLQITLGAVYQFLAKEQPTSDIKRTGFATALGHFLTEKEYTNLNNSKGKGEGKSQQLKSWGSAQGNDLLYAANDVNYLFALKVILSFRDDVENSLDSKNNLTVQIVERKRALLHLANGTVKDEKMKTKLLESLRKPFHMPYPDKAK